MENVMIDAAVVAYAAPADLCVAIADLEVYQPAASMRISQGELRLQAGGDSFRQLTPSTKPSIKQSTQWFGFSATSLGMNKVRNFKPLNGSHAISGTG